MTTQRIIFYFILFATFISSSGCVALSTYHNSDGRLANVVTCEGPSWLACYVQAGAECKNLGYETLEKATSRNIGFWGSQEKKELTFICKVRSSV
jgi:hypothetical protein